MKVIFQHIQIFESVKKKIYLNRVKAKVVIKKTSPKKVFSLYIGRDKTNYLIFNRI
jgi:hypothetical protein